MSSLPIVSRSHNGRLRRHAEPMLVLVLVGIALWTFATRVTLDAEPDSVTHTSDGSACVTDSE